METKDVLTLVGIAVSIVVSIMLFPYHALKWVATNPKSLVAIILGVGIMSAGCVEKTINVSSDTPSHTEQSGDNKQAGDDKQSGGNRTKVLDVSKLSPEELKAIGDAIKDGSAFVEETPSTTPMTTKDGLKYYMLLSGNIYRGGIKTPTKLYDTDGKLNSAGHYGDVTDISANEETMSLSKKLTIKEEIQRMFDISPDSNLYKDYPNITEFTVRLFINNMEAKDKAQVLVNGEIVFTTTEDTDGKYGVDMYDVIKQKGW